LNDLFTSEPTPREPIPMGPDKTFDPTRIRNVDADPVDE
jgi:hypothetical protein